ncbi:MAG TPA: ATP-grasp domain-containing protein, partial [Candidatus Obscuribacterales bacterium]
KTCQWLEANGLNYPRYADCSDREAVARLVSECGYPLIAKPRSGRGAIGVLKVSNRAGLEYALSHADYVLQECLGDEESEYTVGCFSDRDGRLRGTIAMRRQLQHGTTCRAELGAFPEVSAEAGRIARALKPLGPLNVQLRVSNGRPVCFEMNVRFSGTTSLRSTFGWNDVEAALRHFVLDEPGYDLPAITAGGVALRYWDEIYVDQRAFEKLGSSGGLDCPRDYVQSGYACAV